MGRQGRGFGKNSKGKLNIKPMMMKSSKVYVFVRDPALENEQHTKRHGFDRYFPDPEDLTEFGDWVYKTRLPEMLEAVMNTQMVMQMQMQMQMSTHLACRAAIEWAIIVCTNDTVVDVSPMTFEDRCRHFEAMSYRTNAEANGQLYELLMNDPYGTEFCDRGQRLTSYGKYIVTEAFPSVVEHVKRNASLEFSLPLMRMYALEWLANRTTLKVVPPSTAVHHRIGVMRLECYRQFQQR